MKGNWLECRGIADSFIVATQLLNKRSVRAGEVVAGEAPPSREHFVATYHYVRERDSDGVTGITPKHFKEQILAIAARYRLVTAEEYFAQADGEDRLGLITFDDAVKDQALAAELLDELGVPGVFFAPMRPYSDEQDKWCAQHLLHALAEHLGWAEFERRVEPHIQDVEIDAAKMNSLYHYEVPHKRRLKFALAFAVPPERAWGLLREINKDIGLRAEEWYMTESQLRGVQDAGHSLGGHGFDHLPYTSLSAKAQAADMHRAAATMTRLFGAMPRMLAYPFGRYDATTERIARGCGYTMTFGTDCRVDAKFVMDELGRRGQGGCE